MGQITSLDENELKALKPRMLAYMQRSHETDNLNMVFFMLTNIITESSELLCTGPEAREKAISAFDLRTEMDDLHLKGVVSRKKQLVPALVEALQQ